MYLFSLNYMINVYYLCQMEASDITTQLKTRRKELGLTLEQLSDKTGKSKQYLNIIEKGANIQLDKLITICNALNLTITITKA